MDFFLRYQLLEKFLIKNKAKLEVIASLEKWQYVTQGLNH